MIAMIGGSATKRYNLNPPFNFLTACIEKFKFNAGGHHGNNKTRSKTR